MSAFKLKIFHRKLFVAVPAIFALLVLADTLSPQTVASTDKFSLSAYLAYKRGDISLSHAYLDSVRNIDPYAMYVRAALTENANEASNIYREIVLQNQVPSVSRDALIQLYKYHYAIGDYKKAHLDYVALQKFPMVSHIIDPVGLSDTLPQLKTEPIESKTVAQSSAGATSFEEESKGQFIVQVGIFSTRENAQRYTEKLAQEGLKCTLFEKAVNDRTFYAVSAGMFVDREEAENFALSLKQRSINCFVVKK
jgi:hypothetical protein